MVDNSTQNVTTTQSGTGWTVDVTPCNLDPDTTIKDFRVLFDGTLQSNSDFNKNSQTQIEYTGSSISSTTVEIRRVTPPDRIQEVSFGAKFSSALWEAELNRQSKIAHELELNGALGGNTFTAPGIKDDAFGSGWNGDTSNGASRNALFDEITLRAPKQSPTIDNLGLTAIAGNNTAPTVGISNDNNIIATTAFVHGRIDNDLANDPALGDGSTLTSSPSVSDDSDQIATTSFVHSRIDQDLSNDPQLGGGSTLASNPAVGTISTQIATTQFVQDYIEGSNFGTISGTVTIDGSLFVDNGRIDGDAGLDISGGTSTIQAGADIDGGCTISGGAEVDSGDVIVSTDRIRQTNSGASKSDFASGVDVSNGLTVSGGSTIDGGATVNNSLDVDGGCTMSGTVEVDTADLNVSGGRVSQTDSGAFANFFSSGVSVDSGATIDGGANIDGGGSFNGSVGMDTITGGVQLDGNPTLDNDPSITDDSQKITTTSWVNQKHNRAFLLATRSTNQSVSTTSGNITVEIDSEEFDENNDYDTVNHQWTAPVDGFYEAELVTTCIDPDGARLERNQPQLRVTSTRMSSVDFDGFNYLAGDQSNTITGNCRALLKLNSGDTVEPRLGITTNTSFDIKSGIENTRLQIYLIKEG